MDADFWRGRRVFLTGHTGFKGAWLCGILNALGADVTGYALEPEQPGLYEISKPEVRSVTGDIHDFDALHKAYKSSRPEVVIHMAAQPLVLLSYKEPRRTYQTNVMGTVNLLECARQCGCASIVNVTTDKVYRNLERREGYREEAELDGYEPYANSKSCSELVSASYNRSFLKEAGIAVSTARSGNVIGGGDFAENRLVPDCVRAAVREKPIKIRNPESVRPYQHVLDTLFAYLLIAERQSNDPEYAGSYNIGPDQKGCVTTGRLAELFCAAWPGARWTYTPQENPHEGELLMLNCAKIKEKLGWTPRWDIEQSVRATVEWYWAYYHGDSNEVMNRQIKTFIS